MTLYNDINTMLEAEKQLENYHKLEKAFEAEKQLENYRKLEKAFELEKQLENYRKFNEELEVRNEIVQSADSKKNDPIKKDNVKSNPDNIQVSKEERNLSEYFAIDKQLFLLLPDDWRGNLEAKHTRLSRRKVSTRKIRWELFKTLLGMFWGTLRSKIEDIYLPKRKPKQKSDD